MSVPLTHPFFFDGNRWFGVVKTQEDWWQLLGAYPDIESVLGANMAELSNINELPESYHMGAPGVRTGDTPSFGFRREHIAHKGVSLEQWTQARASDLRAIAARKPSA